MDIVHGLRRVTSDIRFDTTTLGRDLGWSSRVSFPDAMAASYGPTASQPVERAVA